MAKKDIDTSEDIKLGKDVPSEQECQPVTNKRKPEKESATIKNAHASGDGALSRSDTELDDDGNAELSK
jgi:hypothetical protein